MPLPELATEGPAYDNAKPAPRHKPLVMGAPVDPEGGRSASGVALIHPNHARGLGFALLIVVVIALSMFFAERLIG